LHFFHIFHIFSQFSSVFSLSFHYFLPYFSYHFPIFFHIFHTISLFTLLFFHIFISFQDMDNIEERQVEKWKDMKNTGEK
jgi:hypothetical protein